MATSTGLSLMFVLFSPVSAVERQCYADASTIESVRIVTDHYGPQVFINHEEYTCLCGQPGESVHIYSDHVLVCCHDHRPTVNDK